LWTREFLALNLLRLGPKFSRGLAADLVDHGQDMLASFGTPTPRDSFPATSLGLVTLLLE
jgi:hypothetical protein